MHTYLQDHLQVFDIDNFTDDRSAFLSALLAYAEGISWDYYDVRRQRLIFLEQMFGDQHQAINAVAAEYYVTGQEQLIRDFLDQMSSMQIKAFHAIVPFRKRAHAKFLVALDQAQWQIERLPDETFVMPGDWNGDYRMLPRVFKPVCSDVVNDSHFIALVQFIAGQVKQRQSQVQQFTLNLHFMSVYVSGDQKDTNSPEGIHQDGADYIVSALVLKREHVDGGVSRIYVGPGKDKTEPDFSIILQPGQGIFQTDAGSELWHDVSRVTAASDQQEGVRMILGLDVSIL